MTIKTRFMTILTMGTILCGCEYTPTPDRSIIERTVQVKEIPNTVSNMIVEAWRKGETPIYMELIGHTFQDTEAECRICIGTKKNSFFCK